MTIAPPRRDDPEALIPEARDRQRRRRLLGVAGVAVAAALGLGLYAVVGGDSHARSAHPSPGGGPPLCRASQLSAAMEWPEGLDVGGWVILTNTGGTACSLPNGAPAAWITWHGRTMPTREEHHLGLRPAEWMPLRTAHVLEPGGKAGITWEWRNWCGAPHSYRPLMTGRLRFGSAVVSFGVGARPPCDSRGAPSIVRVSRPLKTS